MDIVELTQQVTFTTSLSYHEIDENNIQRACHDHLVDLHIKPMSVTVTAFDKQAASWVTTYTVRITLDKEDALMLDLKVEDLSSELYKIVKTVYDKEVIEYLTKITRQIKAGNI